MKFHRLADVSPNPAAGLVCRQSKWNSLVVAIVFSLFLVAPCFLSWWFAKGYFFGVFFGLFALLIIPMLLGNARRMFRPTNWLAWICPDGLWLNVRSFDDDSSTDAVSVVQLDYGEIASIGQHVETYGTPSDEKQHMSRERLESLDICLKSDQTDELAMVIKDNRQRKQPEKTVFWFIKTSHGLSLLPVSLPEPDRIRIVWTGGSGFAATPPLRRIMAELGRYVTVAVPTRHDAGDPSKLDEAAFDRQILRMVETGNRLGAIRLLSRHRGMTTTQAHEFVAELQRQI